jgi:hypothetical protein
MLLGSLLEAEERLQAREDGCERADEADNDAELDAYILLEGREDARRDQRREGDDRDTEPDVEVGETGRACVMGLLAHCCTPLPISKER